MSNVRFCVTDTALHEELQGIVPHMRARGVEVTFGGVKKISSGETPVICVSVLPNDPGIDEIAGLPIGTPCGVLMRTEDRSRWSQLSVVHKIAPLLFVVATGGPQERFPAMFPGIQVMYFSDLKHPYDRLIAEFISYSVRHKVAAA